MTSNLGSQIIKELSHDYETMEKEVRKILEAHFKPEFLNRIDEIIIFKPLTKEVIFKIVDLQIDLLRQRLQDKKINLILKDKAKEVLAERGFDPVYGARPLKRTIQKEIQNPLAMKILAGEFKEGDTVIIDVNQAGDFVFKKK
jgi:ATPases with chaperone activity, ATP-binding subunit